MKGWWFKLWNVFALFLLHVHTQSIGVGMPVLRNARNHLDTTACLACYDLSCWWSSWTEGFCNNNSDWHTFYSSACLLFQNDLEMRWPGDVQEILWVPAPILIFLTLLVNSSSASCCLAPFVLELLFNCVWHLNQLNLFGSKYSEEEWSFFFLFVV